MGAITIFYRSKFYFSTVVLIKSFINPSVQNRVLIIMAVSTQVKTEVVKFPGFKYGVFERSEGRVNLSLYSDIGPGESASVLAPRSSPLADKVAFYVIGRDLALGLDQAETLPEPVKRIARNVYADCLARSRKKVPEPWQATWHKDAVLIEPSATIPGNSRPGEGYVAAKYFQNIERFTEDESDVVATPQTVEERLWLPQGGGKYMFPDVGQNTRFGLPQRTGELGEVVKAYVNADLGLTEEAASREASKFFRGSEGLFAVGSDSSSGGGALCVSLGGGPGYGYVGVGSFPLSRSASGASQASESVLNSESSFFDEQTGLPKSTVTETEYRRVVGELTGLKAKLKVLSE